jgi:ABC-type Fe3+/spermidine/putrescine transport system ATPase subunit
VLLMDEPLGALDLKLRETMQAELRRLQRELCITTIFVTHDQNEAMALADRIAVMNEGHIEQIGTPEEIYRRPSSEFVATFVGKINFLDGTVQEMSEARCIVALGGGSFVSTTSAADRWPGDPVRLGIRPENFVLSPARNGGAPGPCGIIEQRRYFGNIVHYLVRGAGGQLLLVEQAAGSSVLDVGAQVAIGWREEDAVVFPGVRA